jgi:hypothetical protein
MLKKYKVNLEMHVVNVEISTFQMQREFLKYL